MTQNRIQLFDLEQLGIRVIHSENMLENDPVKDDRYYYIHDHPFYELHVVEQGSCLLYAADTLHSLEEGQFCLISPGVYHSPRSTPASFRRSCVSFELMKKSAPVRDWLESESRLRPVWTGDGSAMLPVLPMLRREEAQPGSFSDEVFRTLLALLMMQLVRSMEMEPRQSPHDGGGLDELRAAIVDDFFAKNFNLTVGGEVLAGQLGVSRRQLDRIIRKHFGMSFREKLTEIRARVACDMLRSGDRPISEIAEQVGYSAPGNFTAFFKKTTGLTPQEYRRQAK